jgi:hypothetical protein
MENRRWICHDSQLCLTSVSMGRAVFKEASYEFKWAFLCFTKAHSGYSLLVFKEASYEINDFWYYI